MNDFLNIQLSFERESTLISSFVSSSNKQNHYDLTQTAFTYFVGKCQCRFLLLQLFGPVLLLQQTPRRLLHSATTNQIRLHEEELPDFNPRTEKTLIE